MMRVFEYTAGDNGFNRITVDDRAFWTRLVDAGLNPCAETWGECNARRVRRQKMGDTAFFTAGHMVLSPNAYTKLRPHLEGLGEFLPINIKGLKDTWHSFNLLHESQCIDREKTVFGNFVIYEYAFQPELLEKEEMLFRIKETYLKVFATQRFVDLVESLELTGFRFLHVWEG